MRNPWSGVNWSTAQPIASLTHEHIDTGDATRFGTFYDVGYRHFAISNYYPSDPASSYPLTQIITPVPSDAIGCPNAEHHSWLNAGGHAGAIGSMLATGAAMTPENPDGAGVGTTWQAWVDDVAAELLYANGGGICVNHPNGDYPGTLVMLQMLDYSPLVLGIEAYNSFWRNPETQGDEFWKRWGLQAWHEILVTGRMCFGFGGSDRGRGGRNMLLVPDLSAMTTEQKEEACLVAIRDGHFYGATHEIDVAFVDFSADTTEITVETSRSTDISFYYALPGDKAYRQTAPVNGTTATYTLTGDEVYVWAEGRDDEYERIWTQPVLYMTVDEVDREVRRQRARRFVALG